MTETKKRSTDVLVIDDEEVVTSAVGKLCSLESLEVDVAVSVASAIEKISANYYPIIVCDIMMPDGSGFEILEALNARNVNSAVIMMTGYSTVENAVKSFNKGSVDFIPKPFTVDELLNSIFRAGKHQKLIELERQALLAKRPEELPFVPCPPKYYRLGYASWASQEREGLVLIGVCDLFLKTIESVKEIECLGVDEELFQGISSTTFISNDDRVHKMMTPISGRIAKVNSALKKAPNLIEKDPYFEGWIYGIIPTSLEYELGLLIPCCSDRL